MIISSSNTTLHGDSMWYRHSMQSDFFKTLRFLFSALLDTCAFNRDHSELINRSDDVKSSVKWYSFLPSDSISHSFLLQIFKCSIIELYNLMAWVLSKWPCYVLSNRGQKERSLRCLWIFQYNWIHAWEICWLACNLGFDTNHFKHETCCPW